MRISLKCACGAAFDGEDSGTGYSVMDRSDKWLAMHKPCLGQRKWFDLTIQEVNDCLVDGDPCECLAEPEARAVIEAVAAKLKEKNHGNK